MVLPTIVVVLLIHYKPMYGMIIAFKDFDIFSGIWDSPWASNMGFEHFIDFFNSPSAWRVIRNTLVVALLKLIFLSFPPVILAILINEIRAVRFKKLSQTISYLPHFVSWVVIGGILYNVFGSSGPINRWLLQVGLLEQRIDFISSEVFFYPVVVLSHMWKEMGWESILYLAAIAAIDPNLFEAVEIDGGGRMTKIVHIIIPHILGTYVILFIMQCGRIMSGYQDTFDQLYVLGNVANRNVSDILDIYTLRVGLENFRYSFATALDFFKAAINLTLLLSANWLSNKLVKKGLF